MENKKVENTTTNTVVTENIVDQKPTQIVVVLDCSGSMESIAIPTVEGLNSFIKEQRNAKGDANMTLVQFDHEYRIDYKGKPIKEVKDLINGETFCPRGSTALFDAVGKTINDLNTTDDVIFVIITDGAENASKKYDQKKVFGLIEEKKKMGWNFLFLGANQDAIEAGAYMGISASNSVNYNANADSVNTLYNNVSAKVSTFRSAKFSGMNQKQYSQSLDFNDTDRLDISK